MSAESPPAPVESLSRVGSHRIVVIDGRAGRSGPPLVFLHGFALSASLWPYLLRGTPLDEFPWISLGLPGHFPSEVPPGFGREDVSIELFSDCVTVPVRQYFGETPVHLVGWSTGGFASLAAAAREPELVASVVSLCGFARGRWGAHLGTMQKLAKRRLTSSALVTAMRLHGRSRILFKSFLRSLARRRLEISPELLEILFNDYRRHDMRVMSELLAGIRILDLSPQLKNVKAPVLILGGEADKAIRPKEARHLHEHLPGSQLHEFPGMGHMFFAEKLAGTLGQIEQWIERQQQAPS